MAQARILAVDPALRRVSPEIHHRPSGCVIALYRGSGEEPPASLVIRRIEREWSSRGSARLNRVSW